MKTLLFFLLIPAITFGQKFKTVNVLTNYSETIDCLYELSQDNKVISTYFTLYTKGHKYKKQNSMIDGSPTYLISFIDSLNSFYNANESGISSYIEGHYTSVENLSGKKRLFVQDRNDEYWITYPELLADIKKRLINWCSINKISLLDTE